jgi:hypothetical protein
VRQHWEFRKLRSKPLNSHYLVNLSYRAYWKLLHLHHADKL